MFEYNHPDASEEEDGTLADATDERVRVLVVGSAVALADALTETGYRVIRAASARSADNYLKTRYVSALIVDYELPDLRGDLLYEIASARYPELTTQTIMVAKDHLAAEEVRVAFDGPILHGPCEAHELTATLDRLLHQPDGAS